MKNVTIVTTKGRNQQLQTNASTWGQLITELDNAGLSVDGMKAIIGQTKVTLESTEAELPQTNFTLFLSPVKIKAGANEYDLNFDASEVDDLSYTELRTELKSIRTQASEFEDEDLLDIIGNYTHDKVSQLRYKLAEVYEFIDSQEPEVAELVVVDSDLEARVFEIEYRLGILNPVNEERFNERSQEELNNVLATI